MAKRKPFDDPPVGACSHCHKPIKPEAVEFGVGAVLRDNGWIHRRCDYETSPRYDATLRLFKIMDDWKADPETALADIIGDLAQFAEIQGINFLSALERGRRYAEEETRA